MAVARGDDPLPIVNPELAGAEEEADLGSATRGGRGPAPVEVGASSEKPESAPSGEAEEVRPTLFLVAARRHAERGEYVLSIRYAEEFLSLVDFSPRRSELPELLYVADRVYAFGGATPALHIYEIAANAGIVHPLGAVRQAERLIDSGKFEQSLACLAESSDALDPWGRCVLGSALSKLQRYSDATIIFEAICSSHSEVEHFWERWFSWCASVDKSGASVARFFETAGRVRPDLPAYYHYRRHVTEGRAQEAAELLLGSEQVRQRLSVWDLIPLLYLFVSSKVVSTYDELAAFALEKFGREPGVYKPLIDRGCLSREWAEAKRILAQADRLGLVSGDLELSIKRFELACFTGDRELARAQFNELMARDLPSNYLGPFYRFMAEAGSFSELVDHFLDRVRGLAEIPQVDDLIVRAVRKTMRHEEVLQALSQRIPGNGGGGSENILAVLVQDWVFCRGDPRINDQTRNLVRAVQDLAKDSVKRRIAVEYSIQEARQGTQKIAKHENAIYFCTNLSYLCGAATAVFSLLLNNPRLAHTVDFYVVAENKDEAFVVEVFEPIADYFGVDISVVNEDLIINSDIELREEYGIFTGGVALASAAYYRIYFARYLASLNQYKKALYIDSDVVVNPGLEQIFELDLKGRPLYARLEVDKPEVRAAIEQHGLAAGSYFNSGVLLFHFDEPGLQDCLAKAVDAAEDAGTLLIFQDQCALNVGFAGKFHVLNENFNYFIDPHRSNHGFEEAYFAQVVHFLDRPKPWDALYSGSTAFLWLHHWQKLSAVLPARVSSSLYAAAARS